MVSYLQYYFLMLVSDSITSAHPSSLILLLACIVSFQKLEDFKRHTLTSFSLQIGEILPFKSAPLYASVFPTYPQNIQKNKKCPNRKMRLGRKIRVTT